MAWTNSKAFVAAQSNSLDRTAAFDWDGDSFKVALYNDSITPDNQVSAANSAYNAGQWATANEVWQAVQWPQGGVVIPSTDVTISTNVVKFDGDDVPSGSSATLASVYGVLVYDDTLTTPVADQGVSYNYLGGVNSVSGGVFTVVWHANGIITWTT